MLAYLDTAIGFAVVMLGVSMIIMILTQAISAALSYRGSSLLWGVETLLKKIDPANLPLLTKNAQAVAKAILTNTLVSDSVLSDSGGGWIVRALRRITAIFQPLLEKYRLASAIRPNELVGILSHFVANPSLLPIPAGLTSDPVKFQTDLASEIDKLLKTVNPIVDRQLTMVKNVVDSATTLASNAAAAVAANATPIIQDAVNAVGKEAGKLEAWFNATMDRVSQRFAMHVRICTIILAFLTAGVLQLDAIQLLSKVYTNSDTRNSLVGIAGGMNQIAQNLLTPGMSTPQQVQSTMTNLFDPLFKKALTDNSVMGPKPPVTVSSVAEGDNWIESNLSGTQRDQVRGEFDKTANKAVNDFMANSAKSANQIRDLLQSAGFQVQFPPQINFGAAFKSLFEHFWGIFVSGALLSLGAPFWFNSLKALLNLRPVVAQKQKQEQKAG